MPARSRHDSNLIFPKRGQQKWNRVLRPRVLSDIEQSVRSRRCTVHSFGFRREGTLWRITRQLHRRYFMTITSAHIPAIVALIAGILILIMPRLLNLVVAIYLICIGLIGLGLLRWLHI
jgi:Protein of unknown function (DUF3096)